MTTPSSQPSTEKLIPFTIPNKVPIKLDLEKHNYNSWSSFSLIHLGSLGLKAHVEQDTASTNPEWTQLDDLIKMWILSSLCESLQEQVVTTPGNAKALWDRLKSLFHDNKDARAIALDNELRSIKIGNMSVNDYCSKIQSMATRLQNLECTISEKNLVIYTVNGLDKRFDTLAEIIRHREPLPNFETVRSMLLLKETSFHDDTTIHNTFDSSSSSPTALTVANNKGTSQKSSNIPQLCNHFNKGTCRFGEKCRFIHDYRARPGLNTRNPPYAIYEQRNNNNNRGSRPPQPWNQPSFGRHALNKNPTSPGPSLLTAQHGFLAPPYGLPTHQNQPWATGPPGFIPPSVQQPILAQQSNVPFAGQATLQQPTFGLLGSAPGHFGSQATSLPQAFSTMNLQDPTWHMDTGFSDSSNPPSM